MNLNFYQPENNSYLQNLRNTLDEQIGKLDQLKNLTLPNNNVPKVSQPLQQQRYYLDCGLKEDWDEFLRINYNLTENQIFNDYRLFLQAKAEVHKDEDQAKLEAMKDKIRPQVRNSGINNVQNCTAISDEYINSSNKRQDSYNNTNNQTEGDNNVR